MLAADVEWSFHLVALWRFSRNSAGQPALWPYALARFSPVAVAGLSVLVGAGVYLGWRYIGDWAGLVGTAYGAMVLTKVALMLAAVTLGSMNRFLVRRWARGTDPAGVRSRVPSFMEAEMGFVVMLLLSAAALTSQPPAIDVRDERASAREVFNTFMPKRPQLVPPSRAEMIAGISSSLDYFSPPSRTDRLQSNLNHNVAGVLLLIVGCAAILHRLTHLRWIRHWPLSFLTLGAFLLVIGEPSGWPLGPEGFWETLVVPTVLQHRIATALVVVLAIFEWRVQVGRLSQTRWRYVFPVLCVAGGALLLTHSHTLFATKAGFLIEVSHAAMGVFAVVLGMGRWLELRLPEPDGKVPGVIWRVCLVLIGLVLLFYAET